MRRASKLLAARFSRLDFHGIMLSRGNETVSGDAEDVDKVDGADGCQT